MISAELNKMLVNKLPNLKERYFDEVNWQEGDETGSHTVYGDVLAPYLTECILKDSKQEYLVVFDFLEELLALNDKYATEVVALSVFESLAYLFKERNHLRSYLGEKCKRGLDDVI